MAGSSSAKGRVLVLDDDAAMLATVAGILEDTVSVEPVDTIAAAWAALGRETFDLVVSDNDLGPEGAGVDFLAAVRRRFPLVGRILVTGDVTSPKVRRLAAEARDDGQSLVFYKPIDPADLLSWVTHGVAMARLRRARARF
jgi:DNA-binding NtrC family response regulator